jgi:hypothetical protein
MGGDSTMAALVLKSVVDLGVLFKKQVFVALNADAVATNPRRPTTDKDKLCNKMVTSTRATKNLFGHTDLIVGMQKRVSKSSIQKKAHSKAAESLPVKAVRAVPTDILFRFGSMIGPTDSTPLT